MAKKSEKPSGAYEQPSPSSDDYWKAILAAGGENGHLSSDSSGGLIIAGQTECEATRDIEDELRILREAGIEIIGESPDDFGGVTFVGAPKPPLTENDKN